MFFIHQTLEVSSGILEMIYQPGSNNNWGSILGLNIGASSPTEIKHQTTRLRDGQQISEFMQEIMGFNEN